MDEQQPKYSGALQAAVMRVLWQMGGGNVAAVREALPKEHKSAYTTVQTVLNRLVERGLVERERTGVAYEYRPAVEEPDYVSRTISRVLDDASPDARKAALAQLVGDLDPAERRGLERFAAKLDRKRVKRGGS